MNSVLRSLALLPLLASTAFAATPCVTDPAAGPLLPMSAQTEMRERWLTTRHAALLSMMRAQKVDMWIIATEEFHPDPLAEFVAPPRPLAGNRDFFVFVDAGEAGLKKIAVTGYAEESVKRFFEMENDPRPAKEVFPEIFAKFKPQRIALSMSGRRGVTRSLTHDAFLFLTEAAGPEISKRFVPDDALVEEYLDTRLPEEKEPYRAAVRLTESLVRRALSNEVITPGVTTVGDLRRWLYDALWCNRVTTWFQPDIRVQRKGAAGETSRGFLAVAPEATVIQRGDLLHIDFGVTYMGLNTDWQKMAYVLREGETAPPPGLTAALKRTNALQDALATASRPGRKATEVYDTVMESMKKAGIEAQVYSHPLGNQGHGLGATIDFRAKKRKEESGEDKPLRAGSYLAMELNTASAIPEWDGQKVFVMEEDPVWLDADGWKFFVPRQEDFYLVH